MYRLKMATTTLLAIVFSVILMGGSASAQSRHHHSHDRDKDGVRLNEPTSYRYGEESRTQSYLVEKVRHELVKLPYYNVFDWLEGYVTPDGKVVLRGQVVRGSTKSSAEHRVRDIEGVEAVQNNIEILPASFNDDRIRAAIYRTLFNSNSQLLRYGNQPVPPIHIIVKNGRVTLKGVVANDMDSQLAYTKVSSISGVFSVSNELQVESRSR